MWQAVRRVARHGACPLLLVPADLREIHRVMIACSGSNASAAALRQFAQLRIWPEAEIEVVSLADDTQETTAVLHAAGEYLCAHGISAQLTPLPGRQASAIFARAREQRADLVVAGAGFRRSDHDGSSQAILAELVEQEDLPLFIG